MTDTTDHRISRRSFLTGAGALGVVAATSGLARRAGASIASPLDGTPEQIHLTWTEDPTSGVVVSWGSVAQAVNPRVSYSKGGSTRTVPAVQRTYTDGLNGETVFAYHARLDGLSPNTPYSYLVTADNDANAAAPFSAIFRTAPAGRQPFRFTSFGDIATPNTNWVLSYGQSAYAVQQVNAQQPLFHLLNGDLCYANLNPMSQPEVWRDFGNNNQASASLLPWMPCPGNHELEFNNGPQGLNSYLTRYSLPDNGVSGFSGRWYSFRVGSVIFVSLNADDVILQDCSAFVAGPAPLVPAASTGNPPIAPGTSLYVPGYSNGAQTAWLVATLEAARRDASIDFIVVQMHECALSSSITGNGSDLGIRQTWLPIFDEYEVDLVLCGHDHDYERSFPVRGYDPQKGWSAASPSTSVETRRPHPVTTVDGGVFDSSEGTVHLILGCGGTSANLDEYGRDPSNGDTEAKVFTFRDAPALTSTPGVYARAAADAREDAVWSATRDTSTGYGIGVFDVDTSGAEPTITVTIYHAPGADPVNPNTGVPGAPTANYTQFERFTLVRPRRGGASSRTATLAGVAR